MSNFSPRGGYWQDYPSTYRAEQIAQIAEWIDVGESGAIIGGSGTGKSNLIGFLVSQPHVLDDHIPGQSDTVCLLHLDINALPMLTMPYFYRGLVQTMQDAAAQFGPNVQQTIEQVASSNGNWDDAFFALSTVQKLHQAIIQQTGKKIVWLLDRFDEACQRLDAQNLSSLRSLRDQFKGKLCYAIATRHPVERLRNPSEIDEFYEIIAANTCWVGPMVKRDAQWVANQMAERHRTTFTEAEITQLVEVTGGLPAFLRHASTVLATGALKQGQSTQLWAKSLLARPEFQRNCREIWSDLTHQEQTTLAAVALGATGAMLDRQIVSYLANNGLVKSGTTKSQIFSPLFESFVIEQHGGASEEISLDAQTGTVMRGGIPLGVELTNHENRLLSHFLNVPSEICSKDDLMQAIWPQDQFVEGIRDDRLAQLVKRLREKVEPDASNPIYIQTVRGRGYRFVQPE